MNRKENSELVLFSNHQEAIWLESRLHVDQAIFNIGSFLCLNGIPDKQILETAILNVLDHNDAFHLTIDEETPNFSKPQKIQISYLHFDDQQKARNWMEIEHKKPINLDDDRLFEIQLIQFSDQGLYLFLKYHHIMIDGWEKPK